MFICMQKINFICHIFFEILERYSKLVILGTLGIPRLCKMILSTCRKLLRLSEGKKATSSPMFFLRFCKVMQILHIGYFGQAWLQIPKIIVSTNTKFWYLCASQKKKFITPFFLGILHFKKSWHYFIAQQNFGP